MGLKITISGAYEYFVTFKAKDSAERQKSHPGFFVVDPRLQRPNIETTLPLDGINILTVIPKWMPTVENWSSFFKDFAAAGYNMVHFAPVNTRGISNSPYAIYDQLSISDDLFREKMEEDAKEDTLRSTIIEIQKKHGILSASDIVWNHTACNSEWLQDHPEAGYNLRTAPHLHSAFELDSSLLDFSGQLKNLGLDVINEDHPLGKLMELYYEKYLPAANLWQFYVIDTQLMADKFEKACKAKRTSNLSREHLPLSFVDQAAYLYKHAGTADGTFGRYSKSLDIKKCVPIIEAICEMCSKTELSSQIEIFKRLVDEINLSFYKEWDADLFCIKQNISSRASFLRVDSHGPRLGPISVSNPLVDSYFTRLPKNPKTAKLHPNEMMLANNGWIWNGDPLVNFAGPQSKAYLLRQVIAWGDCVKLRYGDKPVLTN